MEKVNLCLDDITTLEIRRQKQNCLCTRGRIENQTSLETHKTHLLVEQEERNKLVKLLSLSALSWAIAQIQNTCAYKTKNMGLFLMHVLFNWTGHGEAKNELIFSAICIICQVLNSLQTIASFTGSIHSFIRHTLCALQCIYFEWTFRR